MLAIDLTKLGDDINPCLGPELIFVQRVCVK